jgi:hypothetical protein
MNLKFNELCKKISHSAKRLSGSLKNWLGQVDLKGKNSKMILTVLCTAAVVVLLIALSLNKDGGNDSSGSKDVSAGLPTGISSQAPSEAPKETEKPARNLPVIDLSDTRMDVESSMLRINGPISWERELIYSAGNASSIDEPVLVDLYIYNMDSKAETKVTQTQIQFGEIYEGRLNKDFIVWLDTNQRGTNIIYALNRATGEIQQIKKSEYTHPQLRLFGNNMVWVEQIDEGEDRLYLYNLKSGEPIVLETFNIPSYGTCPPSIFDDVVVWAYPSPNDPDKSILKKLDLKKALSAPSQAPDAVSGEGTEDSSGSSAANGDPNEITIEVIPKGEEEGPTEAPSEDNSAPGGTQGREPQDGSMDISVIEPKGLAIYPSTNGQAVAWLDNLNPSLANLKLTLDDGNEIIEVAKDVGRIFGVGKDFVAYMQDNAIMLYFWEAERYARLTAEGEAARLSSVSGNAVVWYDANDPSQSQDQVKVSMIDVSAIKELN